MGAVIIGLRPGDYKELNQIAQRVGRPPKEVAGILLEQAIRRESGAPWNERSADLTTNSREPEALAR